MSDAARLDLRGQECPVPTARTVAALRGADAPEALVVVLDDAICAADIPYHARRFGYDARTDVTAGAQWTITLTRAKKEARR